MGDNKVGDKVGDKVFYTGWGGDFPSGDKVVYGQQGEVMGPAATKATKDKGVNVLFPGNKGSINCYLTSVRRLRRRLRHRLALRAHAPRSAALSRLPLPRHPMYPLLQV